jgi:chromosomal replication initiation ATPase DnaA
MTPTPKQLPLALPHEPEYGRDSFVVGPSNRAALDMIERWPDWPAPVVLLNGPAGSGKSHLARIWAERAGADVAPADTLAAATLFDVAAPPMAVEDVESDRVPERQLFHLINRTRETGASLLITSRSPAAEWRVDLPDLRSRLRMAAPVALLPPGDDLLRQVLVKLFADRQLMVDKAVVDYLLLRMERSLSAAVGIVESLDREALAEGRRITRPMAAGIVARFARSPEEFTEPE